MNDAPDPDIARGQEVDWFTKHILAICCIVVPLLFGFMLPNSVTNLLNSPEPAKADCKSSSIVEYYFRGDACNTNNALPVKPEATAEQTRRQKEDTWIKSADDKVKALTLDPKDLSEAKQRLSELKKDQIERVERDAKFSADLLSGRYAYVAASSLLYVLAFATGTLAVWIIFAARQSWSSKARCILGLMWAVSAGFVLYALVSWPSTFVADGQVLLEQLLDGTNRSKLRDAVQWLVLTNTRVGLAAVCVAILAFSILATRSSECKIDQLRSELLLRLSRIRRLVVLCSLMLVIATFASASVYSWSLKFLIDKQAEALAPFANALTMHLGIMGTIALFAAVTPAIAAYTLDVSSLRSKSAAAAEGLDFNVSTIATTIIAVAAPALTAPLSDRLKTALALWS